MTEQKTEQKLKPKPIAQTSEAAKELDKAEKQFDAFNENVQQMTLDRMNQAPKEETEPQTKIAQRDIDKFPGIYLKPAKNIASREKFNEKFRQAYEFDKEYVQFIAEHNEIKGETMEFWTKPYPGLDAQFWQVPVNKPVWAPRYVAERIKGCTYHRLMMDESKSSGADSVAGYTGVMAVDSTIQRLDARPISTRKSIFMGAEGF